MPLVGGAEQHVVCSPLALAVMGVLQRVIIPKVAHAWHNPTKVPAQAVIGKRIICVSGIHVHREPPLFAVADAKRLVGLSLRLCQSRQQHARQDGDDRYHHQELDQCEGRSDRSKPWARGGGLGASHYSNEIRLSLHKFGWVKF